MVDPEGDGEPDSEVYVAATTRYQSQDIVFKIASRLRHASDDLSARSEALKAAIMFGTNVFSPLAANADKLQGKNLHFGILDELGDHPDPSLLHTFTTSTANRRQPLVISITTAGAARTGNPAWGLREHGVQVLDQVIPDESFFCFIATLDVNDKLDDESVWVKANPSLGTLVQLENLRAMAARAKSLPSGKQAFQRFNLNCWPTISYSSWLDPNDLAKPGVAFVLEGEKQMPLQERLAVVEKRLEGHTCFGGLDLALVNDLSVLCLFFPPYDPRESDDYDEATAEKFIRDDVFECLFKVWVPEDDIERRSKEHRVPYRDWQEQGLLIATPGDVVDFTFIERDILELRERYSIRELGFDVALARDLAGRLSRGFGMRLTQTRQGFSLYPAISRIEKLIKEGRLCLHGNPIANWCLSNVTLSHGVRDSRFDKSKSREKIDAGVALACAIDAWQANEQTVVTPYSFRGIQTI